MNAKKSKTADAAVTKAASETELVNTTAATEQGPGAEPAAALPDASAEAAAAQAGEMDVTQGAAAGPEPGHIDNPLPPDALPPVDPPSREEADARYPKPEPVTLLGKTQGDAAAAAHLAGTVAEPAKPAEPAPERHVQEIDGYELPAGYDLVNCGYRPGQIIDAAIAAHEANRAYCESIGDTTQQDWMLAPEWQRVSALNGVCYAIVNGFPPPEMMHINWMKEKVAAGWQWGVEKKPDAVPPTHPCIVPYAYLPEAQRAKDDLFRDTIMRVLGPRAVPAPEEAPAEAGPPTQEAMAMAAMLACATAMAGVHEGLDHNFADLDKEFPPIAMCLADYFQNEPTAPAAGGLMQVKLKKKVVLLANEDPRRVELALDLFKTAHTRMLQFASDDAKAEADRQIAERRPQPTKIPEGEGTFEHADQRFDKSDMGKALDSRA